MALYTPRLRSQKVFETGSLRLIFVGDGAVYLWSPQRVLSFPRRVPDGESARSCYDFSY
jgi:hypothetical protein